MRSAISSGVSFISPSRLSLTWLGQPFFASSSIAVAETIWPGVQKPHW